mgnify:CR=1 FL=1
MAGYALDLSSTPLTAGATKSTDAGATVASKEPKDESEGENADGDAAPADEGTGAGDEVKLLVVDTYGNIPAVDSVTTVTDESNLGTALKQYTDVTFEGDATISSELEIPAGATLNVKGDLTANAAIVGNGTLNVTGNISDTSKVSTQLESTKTSETVSVSGGVVLGDVTGNVGSGSALYSGDQVKGKVIVQIPFLRMR